MVDITNKIFHDEAAAVAHLEASRWSDGVACPLCNSDKVHRMGGKTQAGMFLCNGCREKFTARTGTVMERSHIPIHKWLLAMHLMAASKKGVSAKQIERTVGVSYKTAWFLMHRIREAMTAASVAETGPLGGDGKVVESDESFVGGKAKNVHNGKPIPPKYPVVALVERGGKLRAKHVADVTAKTVREVLVTQVSRKSELNTDDSLVYYWVGREFAKHKSVNHSKDEYVGKSGETVNSAESFFAILKRGIMGSFHSVSEQHLQRYVTEFEFRWNHRIALEIDDTMRAAAILKGAEGKRLTYRRIGEGKDA